VTEEYLAPIAALIAIVMALQGYIVTLQGKLTAQIEAMEVRLTEHIRACNEKR
jgi:Flp pilus assembly pilin Flp